MKIEIWSDVVCPWCYIGKRRLETALSTFEHAGDVEITWRSYQLDPGAPMVATEPMAESLARKYGGGADGARQMMDRAEAVAAEEGLVYRLSQTMRGNTLDAHRLLHLALHDSGAEVQGRLKESLLAAYFLRAENVSDHEVLRRLAAEVGLDSVKVEAVLGSDDYTQAVYADIKQAQAFGSTGVPFFVIDRKFGVSGAQPAETFRETLARAWSESHPQIAMVAGEGDGACGPDGCAI